MRATSLLSALLAAGLLVQIALGEVGLATRALRDVHATIGLAGLALTMYALSISKGRRESVIYLSVLLAMVTVQAILGLILYGIIPVDLNLFHLIEEIHRFNAYGMLIVGLVGGLAVAVARRKLTEVVAKR